MAVNRNHLPRVRLTFMHDHNDQQHTFYAGYFWSHPVINHQDVLVALPDRYYDSFVWSTTGLLANVGRQRVQTTFACIIVVQAMGRLMAHVLAVVLFFSNNRLILHHLTYRIADCFPHRPSVFRRKMVGFVPCSCNNVIRIEMSDCADHVLSEISLCVTWHDIKIQIFKIEKVRHKIFMRHDEKCNFQN